MARELRLIKRLGGQNHKKEIITTDQSRKERKLYFLYTEQVGFSFHDGRDDCFLARVAADDDTTSTTVSQTSNVCEGAT